MPMALPAQARRTSRPNLERTRLIPAVQSLKNDRVARQAAAECITRLPEIQGSFERNPDDEGKGPTCGKRDGRSRARLCRL
jgi:hypothetical protein